MKTGNHNVVKLDIKVDIMTRLHLLQEVRIRKEEIGITLEGTSKNSI